MPATARPRDLRPFVQPLICCSLRTNLQWGADLSTEHERYLTEDIFGGPVIVYDYPQGVHPQVSASKYVLHHAESFRILHMSWQMYDL